MKRIFLTSLFIASLGLSIAQENLLSVEYIMRDPIWMGTFPSSPYWSQDGQTIYFNYNLEGDPADSLYMISMSELSEISKVNWKESI